MGRRIFFAMLLYGCAALALASGGTPTHAEARAQAPGSHRVITLSPHATELIYAAGGGGYIVGTVSSSDFPEPAKRHPRVGDGILLNQERIIMLRPTVLVGWLRSGIAVQTEALTDRLGAQMIYSRPLRLRDIPEEVRLLGRLLQTDETAGDAADVMDARLDRLEKQYSGQAPVTVFIELGHSPLYTIGDDALLNDALRTCGAINIYASSGLPAPRVAIESVLVQAPQLLISTGAPETAAQDMQKRWSAYGLPAAQLGHIHVADPDALYRPGPRLIDAAEAICAAVDAVRHRAADSAGPRPTDAPIK